jgi:ribonuclease P protein component
MGKFTFSKEERLSKEKWIKELFEKGSSFHLYPFRVICLRHPEPAYPVNQILISVSVRNFKKAVDRNLLKRRIREAYRLQKAALPGDNIFLMACVYTSKEIESFEKISETVLKMLQLVPGKSLKEKNLMNGRDEGKKRPKTINPDN